MRFCYCFVVVVVDVQSWDPSLVYLYLASIKKFEDRMVSIVYFVSNVYIHKHTERSQEISFRESEDKGNTTNLKDIGTSSLCCLFLWLLWIGIMYKNVSAWQTREKDYFSGVIKRSSSAKLPCVIVLNEFQKFRDYDTLRSCIFAFPLKSDKW